MTRSVATDTPVREFDLLKSLEAFVSVAETGSMTAAATRLRITQSAISQQIKLLETDFGAPLFHRDTRPLRLTAAGVTLQNRAASLLVAARQMRADVRLAASGRLPHLRIAMLSTFARPLVAAILRAIDEGVLAVDNVAITRGMTINHAQDLANRDIDVAFTSDAFDTASDLQRLELVRESYLIITPRGVEETRDLRALAARLPFLRYSARTQTGQRIETHLRRMRLDPPRGAMFESAGDLIGAVASGYGWSIVTPSQMSDSLQAGAAVDAHALPPPGLRRAIGLVWRAGEMGDVMRALTQVCRATLEREVAPNLRAALPAFAAQFEVLPDPDGAD